MKEGRHRIRIHFEQEPDGRYLAFISKDDLGSDGVLAYGETREAAAKAVSQLALRVLADLVEHDEAPGWWSSSGLFTMA